jgi:hypothetical protein
MAFFIRFTVKLVFFFLNFLVYFNFTLVARKWPEYVTHWENAERKLLELQVMQHQDVKVNRRIKKIFVFIMFLAFSKFAFDTAQRFPLLTKKILSQSSIISVSLLVFICPSLAGTFAALKKLISVNHSQTSSPFSSSTFILACLHNL